jgi:hypothetical protein
LLLCSLYAKACILKISAFFRKIKLFSTVQYSMSVQWNCKYIVEILFWEKDWIPEVGMGLKLKNFFFWPYKHQVKKSHQQWSSDKVYILLNFFKISLNEWTNYNVILVPVINCCILRSENTEVLIIQYCM